jgi:ATP-dependent HslUV protease ATP-binding subunit HslU
VIEAIAGSDAREQTREMFRKKLRSGELDDREIELEMQDTSNPLHARHPRPAAGRRMGMMNLGDLFGKAFGGRRIRAR